MEAQVWLITRLYFTVYGPTPDWLSSAQEFYFSFSPNVDSCGFGGAEGIAFALTAPYCIINTRRAAESHQTAFVVCWHSKKCLSIKEGCLSCSGLMARADIVLHAGRGIKGSAERGRQKEAQPPLLSHMSSSSLPLRWSSCANVVWVTSGTRVRARH